MSDSQVAEALAEGANERVLMGLQGGNKKGVLLCFHFHGGRI